MTQTKWKPRTQGIIEILPEEIDNFEEQVKKFQAGEYDPTEFQGFRLRQGIYGQRQPDVHMVRVKAPFGGLTADQLDALGLLVGPVSLYGPSYGGAVALQTAARDERVEAVVSVATFSSLRAVVPPYADRLIPVIGGVLPAVFLDSVVDDAHTFFGMAA